MNHLHTRAPDPARRAAFTLIEVLIVVVILGILMAVSAPALDGALRASRLTSAGDSVLNCLSGAQQLAISQNVEVEVRIHRILDAMAGDTEPRARKLEVLVLRPEPGGDAAYVPEGSALRLDDSLAISTVPKFSSLLGRPSITDASQDSSGTGGSASHVAFHFFPDGSTDLPSTEPWFLTVMDERHAASTTAPPNFFTIQIHASSGKLRTFRP